MLIFSQSQISERVSPFQQSDLPSYEDVQEALCRRIATLEELNAHEQIPSLRELEQTLEHQFVRAAELATTLDTQLEEFQGKKGDLEGQIQEHTEWISQLREKLNKVDDVSGSDEVIAKRLETAKVNYIPIYGIVSKVRTSQQHQE